MRIVHKEDPDKEITAGGCFGCLFVIVASWVGVFVIIALTIRFMKWIIG